jgi:hypothetical protein
VSQVDLFGPVPGTASPAPKARRADPATSHAAAAALTEAQVSAVQAAILDLFRRHGPQADHQWIPTYFRLAAEGEVPPHSESGLRTRRRELVDAGHLRDSHRTAPTLGGHPAVVWELPPTPDPR